MRCLWAASEVLRRACVNPSDTVPKGFATLALAPRPSAGRLDLVPIFPHHLTMAGGSGTAASAPINPQDAVAFRPALVRFFRRKLRDINDVEDLVQEVFVRIAARQGGEVENLGGYVFQTAGSVLADRHRRRVVRHADNQVPFDAERDGGTDFDAGRVAENREALRAVAAALMILPERTRSIFVLRRLEGQNYKDIAVQFGISVSAVEKHMVRAVQHLMASPGCMT